MKIQTIMLEVIFIILFTLSAVSASDIDENTLNIDNESSFSDLQNLINTHINESTPISLDRNYSYNPNVDSTLSGGIVINGNITINGNGYTIDGNKQSRIFNLKGSNSKIILDSIDFTNAIGDNGGAVYQSEKDLINITITNCNFRNNIATNNGGSICLKSTGDIIIENNTFTNNIAKSGSGGAVEITSNSIVKNSIFTNNSANLEGGAIYSIGNNIKIINSKFSNNTAKTRGSAISTGENTIINDTIFENNAGAYYGGAVSIGGNSKVNKSKFINNNATNSGGAVNIKQDKSVAISNCEFINNNALNDGGAVKSGDSLIVNSNFTNNSALRYGGAVMSKNLHIYNSEFNNNRAGDSGGSLKIDGSIILDNVTATGGYSAHHGGFLWTNTQTAIINNLSVIGASAKLSGGAAYFTGNVKINNSKFYNNSAIATPERSEGGAINFGYSGDISGSIVSNSVFMYNKAYRGSAIFAGQKFNIKNSTILNNQAKIDKLEVYTNYTNTNQITLDVKFIGRDNLINGIYTKTDLYALNNVIYLKNHTYIDDDKKTRNEIYQNVTVEVYNEYNDLVAIITQESDNNGIAHFDITLDNVKKAGFKIYHEEDEYYTGYMLTLTRNISYIHFESEQLLLKVFGDDGNNLSGNITVELRGKGEVKSYVLNVDNNGFAFLNLSSFESGEYYVSVRYNGDENYLPALNNTIINVVGKIKTTLEISTKNIEVGEKAIINVEILPNNVWGNIIIIIDDKSYMIPIKDGKARLEILNLKAGNYNVKAIYSGDMNYFASNTSTTFKVSKIMPEIEYNISSNKILTLYFPKDSTGKIIITVGGEKYIEYIKNGKVYFNLSDLSEDMHKIRITYLGDDKYYSSQINTQIKLNTTNNSKISSNLSIKATGNPIVSLISVLIILFALLLKKKWN